MLVINTNFLIIIFDNADLHLNPKPKTSTLLIIRHKSADPTFPRTVVSHECHLGDIYKTSYTSLDNLQKACNRLLETQIMIYLWIDMVSHFHNN